MSSTESIPLKLVQEGQRAMSICNACRYCEGYCAVFPALERRLSFAEADLNYLANLCHNCGSCYYACQYAPPHEFALNFPKSLAEIRVATYRKYAWPAFLAKAYERNGLVVSLLTAAMLALFLLATFLLTDPSRVLAAHSAAEGSFYAVIPHRVMAYTFGGVSLFVLTALIVGFVRFWRDTGESLGSALDAGAIRHALADILRLRYLKGGGEGCTYPDERPAHARRWFHHLTFYGFMLCFAATVAATFEHYVLGQPAPYPWLSVPVVLGMVGGVGLVVGPAGLWWLKARGDPALADEAQNGMDIAFLALLLLTSATGLLLLALRETAGMGVLLAIHLGVVMALFVCLPYGKFVHAVYRSAALLRYALEKSRPVADLAPD